MAQKGYNKNRGRGITMAEEWNNEDMLSTYLFENTQLLENLQEIVLEQQDADCFDEDSINEIFRAMHTIKGSSAIMQFDDITKVAHKLEDIFYFLRESHPQHVPHMELITHVLDVADFISGELDKLQDGGQADGDAALLIAALDKFLDKIKSEEDEEADTLQAEVSEAAVVETSAEQEAPQQTVTRIYIPPKALEGSHFYIMNVTYNDIELVNIHAFKLVHNLKGVADNIQYFPQDIITSDESAKKILEGGFQVFIQTGQTEEELRNRISFGYAIKQITITECTQKEFKQALESFGVEVQIEQADSAQETDQKIKQAPGDFVISSAKTAEKTEPQAANMPNPTQLQKLAHLIIQLECMEAAVIQNPDLQAEGLKLERFNEAACQMSAVFSDVKQAVAELGAVFPESEEVKQHISDTLEQVAWQDEEEDEFWTEADEGEDEAARNLRNQYMTFCSGGEVFGLRVSYVTEVIILPEITEMPETADYIKGLIHSRGNVIPVIDVRVRFGQTPLVCNDKTCVIVITYGEHMVGLLVEKISGVVEIPREKLLTPPKVGWSDGVRNQFVRAIGKIDNEIKLLIDPKRLISDREMSALERRM